MFRNAFLNIAHTLTTPAADAVPMASFTKGLGEKTVETAEAMVEYNPADG